MNSDGGNSAYTCFLFGVCTSISVRGVAAIFDKGGPSTKPLVMNLRISSTLVGVSGVCARPGNTGIGISDCNGSFGGGTFVGLENNDEGFGGAAINVDDDDRPLVSGTPDPEFAIDDDDVDDEYFCSLDDRTPFCIWGEIFDCCEMPFI